MIQKYLEDEDDLAVSPVVGVMLMLVVAIIIAAVVSGFAGNIATGTKEAPQLSMDAKIVNSGYWQSSYFKAEVTGVDKPIDTADLKIVTSWTAGYPNGTVVDGGATIVPGQLNFKVYYKANGKSALDTWTNVCPQGYGPGVGNGTPITYYISPYEWSGEDVVPPTGATMDDVWSGKYFNFSWFGNYKLQSGTTMFARPFGGDKVGGSTGESSLSVGYGVDGTGYHYIYGTDAGEATFEEYPNSIDQMQAVLGNNWNLLRPGDKVSMRVIHTPSGKTIWMKDISVEG